MLQKNGVFYVKPVDILTSERGLNEIFKTANMIKNIRQISKT